MPWKIREDRKKRHAARDLKETAGESRHSWDVMQQTVNLGAISQVSSGADDLLPEMIRP
jgi:hypothetical protein